MGACWSAPQPSADASSDEVMEPTADQFYEHKHQTGEHSMKETNTHTVHYPAHAPRKDTPRYCRTHRALCIRRDLPCLICGATRQKDHVLTETHHFFCEKAAESAVDWIKFGEKAHRLYNPQTGKCLGDLGLDYWRQVAKTPEIFVDSEDNMVVLCPRHHRSADCGIHHVPYPEWVLQAVAIEGFTFLTR